MLSLDDPFPRALLTPLVGAKQWTLELLGTPSPHLGNPQLEFLESMPLSVGNRAEPALGAAVLELGRRSHLSTLLCTRRTGWWWAECWICLYPLEHPQYPPAVPLLPLPAWHWRGQITYFCALLLAAARESNWRCLSHSRLRASQHGAHTVCNVLGGVNSSLRRTVQAGIQASAALQQRRWPLWQMFPGAGERRQIPKLGMTF